MVGLPRSGKSTWAKKSGYPIVNPDSIRLALHGEVFIKSFESQVWMMARRMVESLFLAGHDIVILDATSISKADRDEWDATDKWITYFKYIIASKSICIRRAMSGHRTELIPVIEKMNNEFELPTKEERKWNQK